jgi:hypothetical protein
MEQNDKRKTENTPRSNKKCEIVILTNHELHTDRFAVPQQKSKNWPVTVFNYEGKSLGKHWWVILIVIFSVIVFFFRIKAVKRKGTES